MDAVKPATPWVRVGRKGRQAVVPRNARAVVRCRCRLVVDGLVWKALGGGISARGKLDVVPCRSLVMAVLDECTTVCVRLSGTRFVLSVSGRRRGGACVGSAENNGGIFFCCEATCTIMPPAARRFITFVCILDGYYCCCAKCSLPP